MLVETSPTAVILLKWTISQSGMFWNKPDLENVFGNKICELI